MPHGKEKIGTRYITYRQAEEISSLSRQTLFKLINSSCIDAAKVGRAVRIDRDSLIAFMQRSHAANSPSRE